MIKRMIMLFPTALLVLAMALPAFAASPSERDCLAAGGTFDRQQGEVSCVIVTEEEGKNPKFSEETTTTTTGRGNDSNKPTRNTDTDCQRPGQTEKCPPGQF